MWFSQQIVLNFFLELNYQNIENICCLGTALYYSKGSNYYTIISAFAFSGCYGEKH